MTTKPLIAVTMGDPAGIGPEVVAKALAGPGRPRGCTPVVFGSADVLERTVRQLGLPAEVRRLSDVRETSNIRSPSVRPEPVEGRSMATLVHVLDIDGTNSGDFPVGKVSAAAGDASMKYAIKAIELAMAGQVQAIVTAPINKESIHLAGYPDTGHQELLVRLSGAKEAATMLMSGNLRVVHLSTHKPLRDAVAYVTTDHVLSKLKLTDACFKRWGFPEPRIALAALNPHASDGGLIGDEEARELAPAVRAAQDMGLNVRGPFPADSVFYHATRGEFDAVLALYHDQGHIAIKMYGFERSVSVTLGIPFIRTSVDHGTAFDIAGKGIADARSMQEAVKVAVKLAKGKLA